jgi:hypothetical protein
MASWAWQSRLQASWVPLLFVWTDGASRDLEISIMTAKEKSSAGFYFFRHLSIFSPSHIWNRDRLTSRKNTTASAPPARQMGSLMIMAMSFHKWQNARRMASVVLKASFIENMDKSTVTNRDDAADAPKMTIAEPDPGLLCPSPCHHCRHQPDHWHKIIQIPRLAFYCCHGTKRHRIEQPESMFSIKTK